MSLTILLLAAAAAADAKPQSADEFARTMVGAFAGCAVDREPELARRTIIEDWDGRRIVKDRRLLLGGCVPRRMQIQFQDGTLKGAMAALLIPRDLGPDDVRRVSTAPALSYAMPDPLKTVDAKGQALPADKVERQREAIRRKLGRIAIAQFGECVARADPADVPALAKAVFGSAAERTALNSFRPHMPACLPVGVTMELDPATLRDAITLGYYRLAMAARHPRTAEARP